MNPPSIDIKNMLLAESALGFTFGTDLFVAKEPTTPKNCVTIFDTPGYPPDLPIDNSIIENPSIAIRVRSTDYETGYALAEDIKDTLHGRANETWASSYYMVIVCTNGPFLLEWDENRLANFIINFSLKRRR